MKAPKASRNYVIIATQKPEDNLIAKKLPGKFIWKNMK